MNILTDYKIICINLLILLVLPIQLIQAQPQSPDWLQSHIEQKIQLHKAIQANQLGETLNQKSYDVHWYQISMRIDPAKNWVQAAATVLAEVVSDTLSRLELNLGTHLQVDSIKAAEKKLTFAHEFNLLAIALERIYSINEQVHLTIFYQGNPAAGDYQAFAFDQFEGQPHIWTLSEPFGARDWWPCKDTPSDKADSVDLLITVPEALICASNGTLLATTQASGWKTYHWQERYPIATYLVSLAIYQYQVYSDYFQYSPTDSMPVVFYVYPSHYEKVKDNFAQTVPAIDIFSQLFGPYPFLKEKYGHAEFGWSGGMEHQTITSLGSWSLRLIVHELAHQWWGDMITCADFHHIWLNEGFATYSEALYWEATAGREAYINDMIAKRYLYGGTIYVPELDDWKRIFHGGLSYRKASWVLHMLRHVVGDSTFFNILHTYYADPRLQHGSAVTEDFQAICEAVSGMSLDWFFRQWIYGEYYPVYFYQWQYKMLRDQQFLLQLTIEQKSIDGYYFKMPIDITVNTSQGDTTVVVWDSLAVHSFEFELNHKPVQVFLDPDNWILREAFPQLPASAGCFLEQNFPNPFALTPTEKASQNPATIIRYQVNQTSDVKIVIYNVLGQRVKELVNQRQMPKFYQIQWDGRDERGQLVAAGIYLYELVTPNYRETKKMLILH